MLVCALLVKVRLFTKQAGGLGQKAALASKHGSSLAVHLVVGSSQHLCCHHRRSWLATSQNGSSQMVWPVRNK